MQCGTNTEIIIPDDYIITKDFNFPSKTNTNIPQFINDYSPKFYNPNDINNSNILKVNPKDQTTFINSPNHCVDSIMHLSTANQSDNNPSLILEDQTIVAAVNLNIIDKSKLKLSSLSGAFCNSDSMLCKNLLELKEDDNNNNNNNKNILTLSRNQKLKVLWINNITITEQEIANNPTFEITDTENSSLLNKQKLIITAAGLENNLRGVKDGYTFFGVNEIYDGCKINDYLINLPHDKDNQETQMKFNKRLFAIFFDRNTSKFYFRALCESQIYIYIQITHKFYIKHKKYFQIGNQVFHVELEQNTKNISITIHHEDNANLTTHTYEPSTVNNIITIGRSEECNINFRDDYSLSKIHCSIKYDMNLNMWVLYDGYKGKQSTNGTWCFCNSKYELIDDETFCKIGKSVIKIKKISHYE